MRFKLIFLPAILLTFACYGQLTENKLLQAFKSNSTKYLQGFIDNWFKETSYKLDSNDILLNDTLNSLYGILNAFYQPPPSRAKCILMQPSIKYYIVDNLNKDTLLKRAIYSMYKKNPDSIYKIAISKPGSYDDIAEENGLVFYHVLKGGVIRISTQNLKYKEKLILPLTEEYFSILSMFLLDNTSEHREERTKRLNFLQDEIEFCYVDNGAIRVGNYPYGISLTIDSLFRSAVIDYRGCDYGKQSRLVRIGGKWSIIESHTTWIE